MSALPLISICITTYNHEKFLAQALDSVLMQQGDFVLEVLAG
jgi:glycosyltransferase involved in cell wall biosynthesis